MNSLKLNLELSLATTSSKPSITTNKVPLSIHNLNNCLSNCSSDSSVTVLYRS